MSNPANKFITRILIVSDMQTIILVGTNTFQSLEGLEEVGRILAEMLAMNRRIAQPKFVRAPEVPAPTMKTTSYMEYDFASEEQFVFKFKVFERIGFNMQKSQPQENTLMDITDELNPEDLQQDQIPLQPLDALVTVFAIIDSDSPRKLLTAFEFFELQNSF